MGEIKLDDIYVRIQDYGENCAVPMISDRGNPYVVTIGLDFFMETEDGKAELSIFGENLRMKKIANLFGCLILGHQIENDTQDFFMECDDLFGDLGTIASIIEEHELLHSNTGGYRDILHIQSFTLANDVLDAGNTESFFNALPGAIFGQYNVRPQLLCYLDANTDGHYSQTLANTRLGTQSTNAFSPLLFMQNGFKAVDDTDLLVKITGRS